MENTENENTHAGAPSALNVGLDPIALLMECGAAHLAMLGLDLYAMREDQIVLFVARLQKIFNEVPNV